MGVRSCPHACSFSTKAFQCHTRNMGATDGSFIVDLRDVVSTGGDPAERLKLVADLLRDRGGYRWVGLYDADGPAGIMRNIIRSGPSALEYPTFRIANGLTGVDRRPQNHPRGQCQC